MVFISFVTNDCVNHSQIFFSSVRLFKGHAMRRKKMLFAFIALITGGNLMLIDPSTIVKFAV